MLHTLRINPSRMQAHFDALAQIGATPAGGVNRPALSPSHLEARQWFRRRAADAGLDVRVDGAGNHTAVLECAGPGAPSLLLGSHLDSVLDGGRFDGALGVVAALEVLETVKEACLSLPVNLEAIDFTDEEGTLLSLLGSAALAGHLKAEDLQAPRGGRQAFLEGLAAAGLDETGLWDARRDPAGLAGYLELHIEQGGRLVEAGAQIGVVTAIVGLASARLTFSGRADHAGTTTMEARLDAGLGSSAFILDARRLVLEQYPGCVVNVGAVSFLPGAFNIVPGKVELALEYRAGEMVTLEKLEKSLLDLAHAAASRYGLDLDVEPLDMHAPAPMSQDAQEAVRAACDELGLKQMALHSGAGHDGQSLAHLCPVGMIFVPSQGGASHSPREYTTWGDCLNGANVLLGTALRMADKK